MLICQFLSACCQGLAWPAAGRRSTRRRGWIGSNISSNVLRTEREALAAAIPGSRLIGYPDTGHLFVSERPQQVAADIAAFTTQFADRQPTG